jgi:hypothetical protein
MALAPPLWAFRETRALPSVVLGPVDRSHGFQWWISSDCRALRSDVQPFVILCLQLFVWLFFRFSRGIGSVGLPRCLPSAAREQCWKSITYILLGNEMDLPGFRWVPTMQKMPSKRRAECC